MITGPEALVHRDDGQDRPLLAWRLEPAFRAVSSASLGGGLGERAWVVNAQVGAGYGRVDPEMHLAAIAADVGLTGPGVGMITAADLEPGTAEDEGVRVWATVGVTVPTWAADEDGAFSEWRPGTINLLVAVPTAVSDGALVNLVVTATEAKAQALLEAGVPGTGTASDAVCIVAPTSGVRDAFGGPRSTWGGRVGRAVHRAVADRLALE